MMEIFYSHLIQLDAQDSDLCHYDMPENSSMLPAYEVKNFVYSKIVHV